MRKIATMLFLLLPAVMHAQRFEIGVSGGLSVNSKPTNNMYYQGDIVTYNYASQLTILSNNSRKWQTGLDIHVLELSRGSNYRYYYNDNFIGGDGKRFLYSRITTSFCAVATRKIYISPVSKSYFYVGVAGGLVIARNNSQIASADASYKAPVGGKGVEVGAQLGFSYSVSSRFSLYSEFAPRYFDLDYDAAAPKEHLYNLHYRIVTYPLVIGFRYKFGYDKKLDSKTGEWLLIDKQ